MMRPAARQCGVTLVELVVSIVIVALASSAVIGALAVNTAASADPMIRKQAVAVAEAYLEEILLKSFVDPDGADGEAARADFDDVDDYAGLSDAGARDQFGNPLAGLGAYTIDVGVVASTALAGAPAADTWRVDVRVTRGTDIDFTLSGYRFR